MSHWVSIIAVTTLSDKKKLTGCYSFVCVVVIKETLVNINFGKDLFQHAVSPLLRGHQGRNSSS